MKKILAGVMSVSMLAALAVSASALYTERQDITVYKNTPTIDGTINPGEWDFDNVVDMTADNCFAWAGEFTCPVYFYYSWDENGLYCAAQVTDADVCLPADIADVYGKDAFQIALDPAGVIADELGQGGGEFFSIGLLEDGTLGAVYHPWGGAAEEFDYTGAGRKIDSGWEFEMMIPWSHIEGAVNDAGASFKAGDGAFLNAKICYLDRNDGGAETNAYTISLEGTDAGMNPADYAFRLNLTTITAPSLETPVDEAPVDETPVDDAPVVDDTPVAPATADAGIVAAVAVMAAAAGVVLSKKH